MIKTVYHYSATPLAKAPVELASAINKFSKSYRCSMIGHGAARPESAARYDILHAHNRLPSVNLGKKTILQYHSEPFQVDLKSRVDNRLVISQYHATLPQYSNCKIVRNVIDFTTAQYTPKSISNVVRIGFSPSRSTKMGQWHDKGYSVTLAVLSKIKKIYGTDVEIDIITGVPLDQCIARKSNCNIIIDECVTASYHRSGLEGLALGKMTICSLSAEVERVLLLSSGATISPFVNIWSTDLELELCKIIDSGIESILSKGDSSRAWMTKYWHPQTIVNEFTKIYDTL
jgi:hypothetical protein